MYEFTLTGTMPLLMHSDDVESADVLARWRKDPANKDFSVPGDDRSPAWTWQLYLYEDGEHVAMPQENIMAALCAAGAKVPLKGNVTFKSASQSGLLIPSDYCEFLVGGKPIAKADILAMRGMTFAEQAEAAKDLGFELFVKRATIGKSKHIRVRPKFKKWSIRGTIDVLDPLITRQVLTDMFEIAGKRVGLCDWRPSAKKPGPYGTFTAKIEPLSAKKSA